MVWRRSLVPKVRWLVILGLLSLTLVSSSVVDPTVAEAASSHACAEVTSWSITVNSTYFFLETGGGWISSYTDDASGEFGTVDLTVTQTSFHAYNQYTGSNTGYTATFTGKVGAGCQVSGTWVAHPYETGVFTASPQGYATPPPCSPHLAGSLHYETGETVIKYTVSGISEQCDSVDVRLLRLVSATSPDQVQSGVRSLSSSPSTQSGSFVLSQRFCTQFRLSATAPDPGKPPTTVSLRVGHFGTDGTVIYAKGDVTGPEGETLSTGDPLCTGENGARYPITDESNSVYVLDTSLEHDLKLHVGSDGALWFGIGTFGPASPPLTGGVIDVPAAHINVIGAIAARRLVLGLGNGQTVTLQPPETAPADLYPADEANPVAGKGDPNNLEKITKNPERGGPFTGFVAIIPTREVIAGATQFNRAFFGANGSVDFQGGIPGFGLGDPLGGLRPSNGAVIARGNITVSGPIDLETDNVVAFVSLGTVSLLGT